MWMTLVLSPILRSDLSRVAPAGGLRPSFLLAQTHVGAVVRAFAASVVELGLLEGPGS